LHGSQFEPALLINSGPIDVSDVAGTTNEFFVGIVGGTSTNAQLVVQDVQFFSLVLPSLQTRASGNSLLVSWPLSAQDFSLQTATNLADSNSWITLTNVPAIANMQNTVTNPIVDDRRFYRLQKQ